MPIWYKNVFAKSKPNNGKCVVVDFDGTIAADKYPDIGNPLPAVRESLRKLKDAGCEIVIFTARCRRNDGRPEGEPERQKEKILDWLKEHDIPYTSFDDGYNGKPHCDYFVDNKALHYGGDDDWESIAAHILGGEK